MQQDDTELTYYGVSKKIEEQTKIWLGQFNEVPKSVLDKIVEASGGLWDEEVCKPLYHMTCKQVMDNGYACRYDDDEDNIEFCGSRFNGTASCDSSHELFNEDIEPMWGTLFQPQYMDRDWFRENAQKIYEELGLLVYDNEDYDILVGVNSAGHDFYAHYWTKLYIMRGLKWHEN